MDLFDYLERVTWTFDERALGTVDSAALSQICMIDGSSAVGAWRPLAADAGLAARLADRWHAWRTPAARFSDLFCAENFSGMFCGLTPEQVKRELAALVASPRFRGLELCDYTSVEDEDANVQFAAMTFVWHAGAAEGGAAAGSGQGSDAAGEDQAPGSAGEPGDFAYVAFRGTDDSFVGWKENLNMAINPPVPAQELAVRYLDSVANHLPERLYVGGHSKGANLATYAALRCSEAVRGRIVRVFDHDGPGFKAGFVADEEFARLEGRIVRTVPEEDVVGMLMETPVPTLAVRSRARGIDAHSIFTWEIAEPRPAGADALVTDTPATAQAPQAPLPDFDYAERLTDSSRVTHDVFAEWIAGIPADELPQVAAALFEAIEASGAQGAGQLFSGGTETVTLLLEAARNMSAETRDVLVPALTRLAAIAARLSVASALQLR